MIRMASLWLLTLGAPAAAADDEPPLDVRNRFTTAAWLGVSQTTGDVDLEIILSDALRAVLVDDDDLQVTLIVAARGGYRVFDERLDDPRVRALGVQFLAGSWTVDLGRFTPLGGGWRLTDGVQFLAEVGRGVRLGAWAGLAPDPYTTLPALRFGGGPVLTWSSDQGELTVLGEVLGTPKGIDRASGVVRARVEVSKVAELGASLDLQGAEEGGARLSDATLWTRLNPTPDLQLDLVYDAWSSLSYLVSQTRDPMLTRYAMRSQALLNDPWTPQDTVDPTVSHLAGLTISWRPPLGTSPTQRFLLNTHLRYRHHDDPYRRNVNAGLMASLLGLGGGRVDVGLGGGFLWWLDQPGGRGSVRIWAQLDRRGLIALDTSADLFVQQLPDTGLWTPSWYADLFLDARVATDLSIGVGYMLQNTADLELWDVWHGGMLRLSWRVDTIRWASRQTEGQQ